MKKEAAVKPVNNMPEKSTKKKTESSEKYLLLQKKKNEKRLQPRSLKYFLRPL